MLHVVILYRSSHDTENVLQLFNSLPVSTSVIELSPNFIARENGIVVIDDRDGDCRDHLSSIDLNGSELVVVSNTPDKYKSEGAATVIPMPLRPNDFIGSLRAIINKIPGSNSYFVWCIANKAELLPGLREKLGRFKNFERFFHLKTVQPHLLSLVYHSIHLNSKWSTQPLIHMGPQDFSEEGVHNEINSLFDVPKPPKLATIVLSEIDAYTEEQVLLLNKIIFFLDEFSACIGRVRIMTSASKSLCDIKFPSELLLRLDAFTLELPDLKVLLENDSLN